MGSSISSIHIPLAVMHDSPKRKASKSLGGTIGIPKSNREKKQDLVATGILGGTGILPVILGRLASRPLYVSPMGTWFPDETSYVRLGGEDVPFH
jgi:hypothetical protein